MEPGDAVGREMDAERYAHFLIPIRDMEKNWEIDIAFYLEEYLAELEHVAISFDCGKTVMNFADAALLIQGSACVYSRKVDFLYTLVLQLLDILRCSKKQRQQQTANRESEAGNQNVTQTEDFLDLDDCESQHNISLKENESSAMAAQIVLPKTPAAVIPLDSDERQSIHLKTQKNELLGYKSDFCLNSMDINRCGTITHDSNTPETNVSVIETPRLMALSDSAVQVETIFDHGVSDNDIDHDDPFPAAPSPEIEPCEPENVNSPDSGKFYNLRKRASPEKTATEKAELLWKLANPHEEIPLKNRPARKGRTLNVLKTVENVAYRSTRRLRRKKAVDGAKLPNIGKFCSDSFFSHASKLPINDRNVICPSMENLFHEEYKRRKILLQNIKAQLKNVENPDENDLKGESDADDAGLDIGDDDNRDGGFDSDDGQPFILPTADEAHVSPLRENRDITQNQTNGNGNESMSYEDLIRKHTEDYIASIHEHSRRTSVSKRVKAWEESLTVILDDEEAHDPYDIRDYCGRVLKKFSANNRKQTLPFSKVVAGQPAHEVARIFLASLQLANNYNIDMTTGSDSKLELTLLSRRQHFEDLSVSINSI